MNEIQILFQEGVTLAQTGRRLEARRRFRHITKLDANHESAWLYLIWLADEANTANNALERVGKLNPTHPSLSRAQDWVQQRWLENSDADQVDAKFLYKDVFQPKWVTLISLVIVISLLGATRWFSFSRSSLARDVAATSAPVIDLGLSDLQQSLDLAEAASDRNTMIDALVKMKDLAPANKAVERQLAQLYYEQGLLLRNNRKFTEAKATLAKALTLRSDWDLAQQEIAQIDLFLSGAFHHQNANWAEAIPVFEKLYEENPNYPNVTEILYSAYFNQGIVQKAQGELEEALISFEGAARVLPAMTEAEDKIAEVAQLLAPPPPAALSAPLDTSVQVDAIPETPDQKRVIVDISEQRTYVYSGDELVFDFVVSTGEPGRDTAIGEFEILDKIPMAYASTWNLDMPFWLGIYWAGPLENGFHAVPTQRATGVTMWEGYLGQRVSYGCIVLSMRDAETLYNWVDVGTPVKVQW